MFYKDESAVKVFGENEDNVGKNLPKNFSKEMHGFDTFNCQCFFLVELNLDDRFHSDL